MKKRNWILLAGCGLVALIVGHGVLIAWGIKLSNQIGGWFTLIAGGALLAPFLYHGVKRLRGHALLFGGHLSHFGQLPRGPHAGFLVNLGHGFVEVAIFETDAPPRFRLFFFNQRQQARSVPAHATVTITTVRPHGARDIYTFRTAGPYLESTVNIPRPHEFKAVLQLSHGSHLHTHEVQFSKNDVVAAP